MNNRALRRLMKQAEEATGLSKQELREILGTDGLPSEAEQELPTPAAVNPLIRPNVAAGDGGR